MGSPLSDLIDIMIENRLNEFHTSMPGRIVTYNPATQEASVQPLIKRRYHDDQVEDQPVIAGVPVVFPASSAGSLTFPLVAGDNVLLLFSESSLDAWLYSDGNRPVDPNDYRRGHYADAIAIAGLFSFKKAIGSHPTDVVLEATVGGVSVASVSLSPSGTAAIDATDTSLTGSLTVADDIETGGVFKVEGVQVVGPQLPNIVPATNAATVITQFNLLLAACKLHGLVASV